MWKNFMRSILGMVVFPFLLVSCKDLFPSFDTITVDFDYTAFVTQRDLWEATQPPDYQYLLYSWSNGYSIPFKTLVKVENGQFKEQITEPGYMYPFVESYVSPFFTISTIYSSIEQEYKEYNHSYKPKSDSYLTGIEMEYDKVHHIPLKITTRYYVPPNLMDAASISVTEISNFEIINK